MIGALTTLPRRFAAAVMLLTRVPMPAAALNADPGAAAVFYPLVGGLVGASLGVLVGYGPELWPLVVLATLAVAFEVIITGALHLDGLADCADSLGGHTRDRKLAIMKDHSIGVYGAAAIVLALLMKVALILTLAARLTGLDLVLLLAAAYGLSRASLLPLARWLPYARGEGTAAALVQGLRTQHVVTGLVLAALLLAPVLWIDARGAVATTLLMAGSTALVAGALARTAMRRLGGITGDVLGACAELTLITSLLSAGAVLAG